MSVLTTVDLNFAAPSAPILMQVAQKTTCKRCGCGWKGEEVTVDAPANVALRSSQPPQMEHEPEFGPNQSRMLEPVDPNRRRGIPVRPDEGNEEAEAGAAEMERRCVMQRLVKMRVQRASIGRSMDKGGAVQHILVRGGAVVLW